MSYFINQIKEKDCGFACLKMVLATINKNEDYLFLEQRKNDDPYTLKELIKIAEKNGLTLEGSKVPDKDEIAKIERLPAMAVIIRNDKLHMVVINKINNKKIKISDPATMEYEESLDEFKEEWTGELLEIKDFEKTPYKAKKVDKLNNNIGYQVISIVIELIAFVSAALALYLCQKSIDLIYSILLCCLFAILLIISKKILNKGMKKFDQNIVDDVYLNNRDRIDLMITEMNNFKGTYFVTPIKLVYSALVIILSIVILGMDSLLSIAGCLIIIVLELCVQVFVKDSFNKDKIDLIKLEESLKNRKLDDVEFESNLALLNKKTYSISSVYEISRYAIIVISFILAALLMGFSKINGVNFIIFYALIFIMVGDETRDIATLSDNFNKINKYKCMYLNSVQRDDEPKKVTKKN